MAVTKLGDLVGEALERALDFLRAVGGQGVLQMPGDAVVVHEDARRLPVPGSVHAGDGLEQLGLSDGTVEVHDALDGRVEAGEEHRLHDEEGKWVTAVVLRA